MTAPDAGQILADLGEVLANFHGREYSEPIGRETRFFADMGLASIDAVVLGETLEARYGRKLPFGDLMAELGARADRDLSIGELVDFLRKHLADPGGGRTPGQPLSP